MRGGLHRARFAAEKGGMGMVLLYGVVRPTWDVEHERNPHNVADHHFYDSFYGRRYPEYEAWGAQPADGPLDQPERDTVTLELDLDAGTLCVWKNAERLGVMATGLSGEFVWAMAFASVDTVARITSAPGPGGLARPPTPPRRSSRRAAKQQ